MILSRIIHHLKTQNWTAVGLEFLIVILGVVIGFQVTAWNASRQDRAAEHQILVRLQDEAESLLGIRDDALTWRQDRTSQLREALRIIFLGESDDRLTAEQCRAILASHIYSAPPDGLPTLEDLLSTGRLDLIENNDIRQTISTYLQTRDETRNFTIALNNQLFRLANLYPHMIHQDLEINDDPDDRDGFTRLYSCDTQAMRLSDGFRNDFLDNSARYASHTATVAAVNEALAALVIALDADLGDLEE